MPGTKNTEIIEALNEVLTAELTAINQYFIHAKMCQNWGYQKLGAQVRQESIDEMKHADAVIERILYLDGIPNMQRLWVVKIGETVEEQFTVDHALEIEAVKRLNAGIELCREGADNGTRALLEAILTSEEEHIDWLDAQFDLIKQVGMQNYLAQQING